MTVKQSGVSAGEVGPSVTETWIVELGLTEEHLVIAEYVEGGPPGIAELSAAR